jgi:copper chaperone CopZ
MILTFAEIGVVNNAPRSNIMNEALRGSSIRKVDTRSPGRYHAKMIMNLIFKHASKSAWVALLGLAISLPTIGQAAQHQVRMVLKGMVCAYCVQGLTRTLGKDPEIESVNVRLASRDAVLKVKTPGRILEAKLHKAAIDSGLQLERIEYVTE